MSLTAYDMTAEAQHAKFILFKLLQWLPHTGRQGKVWGRRGVGWKNFILSYVQGLQLLCQCTHVRSTYSDRL